MAYRGKFSPKNIEKYKGKTHNIEYRSSWEATMMRWCDLRKDVVKWNSEEVIIPYRSTADNGKKRRYYMDFWVKFDNGKEYIFEVKPFKETQPPEPPKRKTAKTRQRFLNEIYTYTVNQDKWKAAQVLAHKEGWIFKVLTEHGLRKLGMTIL